MSEAKVHANELAISLNEQKQGLSGNTAESEELLSSTNALLDSYNTWVLSNSYVKDNGIWKPAIMKRKDRDTYI